MNRKTANTLTQHHLSLCLLTFMVDWFYLFYYFLYNIYYLLIIIVMNHSFLFQHFNV